MHKTLFPAGVIVGLLMLGGCRNSAPAAPAVQETAGQQDSARQVSAAPGKFDYYLFTLTWTPEYCHDHRSSQECGGSHRGFVVHGLWPQNFDGSWPQACSSSPGPANADQMLDLMPDRRLIQHEWQKHGTCTGLTAQQYFDTIRHEWQSIHVPPMFVDSVPDRADAQEIKRAFTDANAALPASAVAVQCHNRYLAGVQICLDKQLNPTACKAVPDCDELNIKIPSMVQDGD